MDRQHYRHELLQQRVQEWGMNVESLARRLEVSPAKLNAALHGRSTCFETLHKLADALGISMLELMRTGSAPPAPPGAGNVLPDGAPGLTREAELLIAADQALKLARAALQSADAALAAQQELLRTNPPEAVLPIPPPAAMASPRSAAGLTGAAAAKGPGSPGSPVSPVKPRMKDRLVAHRDRSRTPAPGSDRPLDQPHDPTRQKAVNL